MMVRHLDELARFSGTDNEVRLFFFFFKGSGAPRDLHSSPTRPFPDQTEPRLSRAARLGVDQERGADLDHDAAEIGEGGGFGGHGSQRSGRQWSGRRLLYSRLTAA